MKQSRNERGDNSPLSSFERLLVRNAQSSFSEQPSPPVLMAGGSPSSLPCDARPVESLKDVGIAELSEVVNLAQDFLTPSSSRMRREREPRGLDGCL